MQRFLSLALALLLPLGCSDPSCRDGEIQIGNVCHEKKGRDDGGSGETTSPSASTTTEAGAGLDYGSNDAAVRGANLDADVVAPDAEGDSALTADPSDAKANEAPACVASLEVCDGVDNDCDGNIDEEVAEAPIGVVCSNNGDGACNKPGKQTCIAGKIVCDAPPATPGIEICDGIDNDCNGKVDDAVTDAQIGADCTNDLLGVCLAAGKKVCVAGKISCNAPVQTGGTEICDGKDNNCNGTTDEGVAEVGADCMTGKFGVCSAGKTVCGGGALSCVPVAAPSAEVCDNKDNDCNGSVDDGVTAGFGASCDTGKSGVCAAGTTACSAGATVCIQSVQPSSEVCDGVDNDCDGTRDEEAVTPSCSVGVGGCQRSGHLQCVGGQLKACDATPGQAGNGATCPPAADNVDNDCDGTTDEFTPNTLVGGQFTKC